MAPEWVQDDFKKLADDYHEESKKLDEAAEKGDMTAADAAFKNDYTTCMACRKAHKPA